MRASPGVGPALHRAGAQRHNPVETNPGSLKAETLAGEPGIYPGHRPVTVLRAAIYVRGAWAELRNAPDGVLDACLTVPHPKPWVSRAFREKRWDGRIRLFRGSRFPAGLTPRVVEHLQEMGRDVFVSGFEEKLRHDWSRIEADYLPRSGKFRELWPHQLDAVHAALAARCGIVKSPTGSGKSEMIAVIARALFEEFAWNTLILVPKKGLMHQTVERLQRYYQDDLRVGWMGDGERVEGDVVVATAQTMQGWKLRKVGRKTRPADPLLRGIVRNFQVIIGDEVHRASSTTWFDLFMHSGAHRRYGFSATPLKADELSDLRMIGATGPILYSCDTTKLIDAGLAARPKIAMVMSEAATGPDRTEKVARLAREATIERRVARGQRVRTPEAVKPEPQDVYRSAYRVGVAENRRHNAAVIQAVQWLVEQGRKPLVMCRYRAHWEDLRERLEETGISFLAIWGASDKGDRDLAKKSYGAGTTRVVLATGIWEEGEDIPGVDAIVLAEGVKSVTNALQRIGRGMRRDTKDVWVVDFVPTSHPTLRKHAVARAESYEQEGYEVVLVEKWPEPNKFDVGDDLLPFKRWKRAIR